MTTSPQPPEEPIIPDDVWEKFTSDTEASIRATAPKEPSARARLVTRRLQEEQDQQRAAGERGEAPRTGKRSWRERRQARRAGFGPERAPRPARPGGSFLDRFRLPIVLVLTLAVGLLIWDPMAAIRWLPGVGGSDGGSTADAPPNPGQSGKPAPPTGSVPLISPARAFPDAKPKLPSGAGFERVRTVRSTTCPQRVSTGLERVIGDSGAGCAQQIAALYTDSAHQARFSLTVITFALPEDLGLVLAMASSHPEEYRVDSLAPAAGSPLPQLAKGASETLHRMGTERSVVFANAQWAEGADQDAARLSRMNRELLDYVADQVAEFEEGQSHPKGKNPERHPTPPATTRDEEPAAAV
ncbi:hypothetical protein [Streptomyces palmae]|uniref:Uncharacterized protein n=1 Tax=Streptomyces palmae TaxID=1701085 RepID=A0A4Z0H9R5_9ACTN|nr:hypothetical protein [Streptomyces palmae]TGB11814.1 hypothetical protein E4099_11730 [Streptomyces palmae]